MTLPVAIVGCDPGKMTGAAIGTLDGDRIGALSAWEMPWYDYCAWLDEYLPHYQPDDCLVLCERFVISGASVQIGRGDENWSIEAIGASRYLARKHGARFDLRGASDAKKFAPDSLLRSVSWYTPGRGHANDAVRLVVLGAADLGIAPPWV